jgi:hypothetical protein
VCMLAKQRFGGCTCARSSRSERPDASPERQIAIFGVAMAYGDS